MWIGVSCDLLITSDLLARFVWSFDEDALLEDRAGADQVRRVYSSPAGLRGLDELERHRHSGCPGTWSLGDPLAKPHGREHRLDRVRRPQVDPVLGGPAVEQAVSFSERLANVSASSATGR